MYPVGLCLHILPDVLWRDYCGFLAEPSRLCLGAFGFFILNLPKQAEFHHFKQWKISAWFILPPDFDLPFPCLAVVRFSDELLRLPFCLTSNQWRERGVKGIGKIILLPEISNRILGSCGANARMKTGRQICRKCKHPGKNDPVEALNGFSY